MRQEDEPPVTEDADDVTPRHAIPRELCSGRAQPRPSVHRPQADGGKEKKYWAKYTKLVADMKRKINLITKSV